MWATRSAPPQSFSACYGPARSRKKQVYSHARLVRHGEKYHAFTCPEKKILVLERVKKIAMAIPMFNSIF